MASKAWLPLLLVALFVVEPSDSARILGYFITPSRSHFIIHDSLMRGLAAKGHQVTVVSLFPPPDQPIPNYTAIQLDMSPESQVFHKQMTSGFLAQAEKETNLFTNMPTMLRAMVKLNTETYTHPAVEKLRREQTFDLIVLGWFFNDFQIGLAAQFKCPAVIVASMEPFKPLRDYVGNPSAPAYTPMAMTGYPSRMSYWQRVANFGFSMFETALVQLINTCYFEPSYVRNFPPDKYPSFDEAKKNVALVLVTAHFSQGHPTLNFPAMVEVSGMHIKRKPDPLPKDIQEWLDTATNGVVYFCLGSNIKSKDISEEKITAILNVFARLKNVRVLWKFENDKLPGKPDHVMIQKWLPQDDVLAHPNIRLFITHCGKGGLNEARYHGVPILGIPIFADQPANLALVEKEGWAVPLLYSNLTESTFDAALAEALTNSKYGEVVKSKAQLFRDRPQHPLDTAIYWVEYVIRHKGAKHMQSAVVHLTWYQHYSLDVIAFYLAAVWVGCKLIKIVLRGVWRLCCGRSNAKTKNE